MKILCNLLLLPAKTDVIEYYTVGSKGYPVPAKTAYAKKEATIIVGHREEHNMIVTPEDKVYTALFASNGRLSSVGKELEGQELTVIIHVNNNEGLR